MAPTFTPEEIAAEEWRPVVGYPNYGVSNLGRVRSAHGVCADRFDKDGYRVVRFRVGGRPTARVVVHRLVLEAFVGPRPEGCQCAHINGVRSDARAENLRWVTRAENASHKYAHGTVPFGRRMSNARLTDDLVIEARARRATGETWRQIAAGYGVSESAVWAAATGRSWRHLAARIRPA